MSLIIMIITITDLPQRYTKQKKSHECLNCSFYIPEKSLSFKWQI